MSKLESNFRQSLIIKTLRRRPATFPEIQEALKEHNDYYLECSIRTFQRDLKDIASFYDIEIEYNRRQKVYEINSDQMGDHEERLLETFDLLNALNYTSKHSKTIILEKRKPLGTEHLHGLLHAISNRLEVNFTYENYWELKPKNQRRVQPIALKEAQSRWYVIAKDTKDKVIKTFGLDRMTALKISDDKFEAILNYSPEKAFQHYIGVINTDSKKPEKILLSFTQKQAKYVQSLPLHHSQKVVSETESAVIIELFLIPTYDFVMELMAMGAEVMVIAPASLKAEIQDRLEAAIKQYGIKP